MGHIGWLIVKERYVTGQSRRENGRSDKQVFVAVEKEERMETMSKCSSFGRKGKTICGSNQPGSRAISRQNEHGIRENRTKGANMSDSTSKLHYTLVDSTG